MRSPSRAAKVRRAGWSSPVWSPAAPCCADGSASAPPDDGVVVDPAAGARQRRIGPTDDLADLGAGLAGRADAALSDHRLFLPVLAWRTQRFRPVHGSRAR